MMKAAYPTAKAREYGNTAKELRSIIIPGLVLGLFCATASAVSAYFEHRLDGEEGWIIFRLLFAPAVVMFVAVFPTLLFHIRLVDSRVQHVFLGRHILSDYPVSDFLQIRRNHRGVVICFKGNRKIYFFGAHLREIERLSADLSEAVQKHSKSD